MTAAARRIAPTRPDVPPPTRLREVERPTRRFIAEVVGDRTGGRTTVNAVDFVDGAVDYDRIAARPAFAAGLARVRVEAGTRKVALMCAEREPLDCHRCLLIGRAFAERGLAVGHILGDGTIEPHSATEERLLAMAGGDLFRDRAERLAAAYRRRAQAVAARLKRAG